MNAFDVTRTDRDEAETPPPLSSLMPHIKDALAAPTTMPGTHTQPDTPQAPHASLGDRVTPAAPPDRSRGGGGRAGTATRRITATAARVPVELYEATEGLVKGPGKPSWGQLVAWTCQTQRAEVVDAVLVQLRPSAGLIPRGQNKRARGTTQVTARFALDEHAVFAATLQEARAAADRADLPAVATATTVVIAALEVATH